MRKIYSTILFTLLITVSLFAQTSTMWLMNGKKVVIQKYSLVDDEYDGAILTYTNLKGKQKTKDADDVFSVTSANNQEEVIYKKDLNIGNEFEVDEMRNFLSGKTDIKKTYKGIWFTAFGVAAGIAGGALPPLKTSGIGGGGATIPLAQIVPVTYVIIAGNTTKTFEQLQDENPNINTNEHYLMGCQKGIQEKRLKNSIIGACIGIAAGIVTMNIVQRY